MVRPVELQGVGSEIKYFSVIKLLGKESDDIDITLDNLSGEQLAKLISLKLYGNTIKYGVTKLNSEKSKHLETACIKIYDMPIDLVNLRSETYSDSSRIPEIVNSNNLEKWYS